jgi:Fe-S-cluster containining protein
MDKPVDTWCDHADPTNDACGCKDYENRPNGCRAFACGWLKGMGDLEDRPDKLGVMMQPITHPDIGEGIAFVEAAPGAIQSPKAQWYLAQAYNQAPGRIFIRKYQAPHFTTTQLTVNRMPTAG